MSKQRSILVFSLALFLHSTCTEKGGDEVMTVNGPVAAEQMGTTLSHEHILVDFIGASETGYHRWDRSTVVTRIIPFLEEAQTRGVSTILECTPAFLGRDPRILKELSEETGIHLVTNTGLYGAVQDKYIPEVAYGMDDESIASIWIDEFENGIEDTGIRPGFIKIAVDRDSHLSAIDEKILRAAILTHKKTGLTMVSHTGPDGPAFAQMAIMEAEQIDLSAWVWTHAGEGSDEGRIKAAKMGAWISIDDINKDHIGRNVDQILAMKSAGLLNKLLVAHDAGWYQPGEVDGGQIRGYTDIFSHLIPALLAEGLTQKDIDQLLIENPKEAYALRVRVKP